MTINENSKFTYDGNDTEFSMLDFWKFQFSQIYDLQDNIAEFIVAKALNKAEADNKDLWTLYDIAYRDKRIEVKETSYYHAWQTDDEPKSKTRVFGITKANSSYENPDEENRFERQNDIYVFCLNTGYTKAESYPLNLNNWEFYIIPTQVINEKCGNNKTITLSRIKNLGYSAIKYGDIKNVIDSIIDEM